MLTGLRELAELVLGLCFDLVELVQMLQIPVTASSAQGPDKVKALQLSAFLTIAVLIAWSTTTHQSLMNVGQPSWGTIGIVSTIYLSLCAWLNFQFLQATTGRYDAHSDLKLDALSVVLGFDFLVILAVAVILELNYEVDRHKPFELDALDGWALHGVLLVAPVLIAAMPTLINSLRYLRAHPSKSLGRSRLQIAAFTLLNVILADIFVYLMYVVILGS